MFTVIKPRDDVDIHSMSVSSLDDVYPDGSPVLEVPDDTGWGSDPLLILLLQELNHVTYP